ncbi:hypothetical protein CLV56_3543 [Mumia flava]|uniref:Transposase n=1 Tax=Mumia flava TaxID=1348852 RepID=A0A0B2BG26_9ACTN|nr:hypothetical protein [Mumia flava]PJJ54040.1 hypothetical protein CLV56_3543 [Mumia flava]
MAKALLGSVVAPNPNLAREAHLRRRIADLEAEILRLKSENDQLLAAADSLSDAEFSTADLLEPAGS